MVKTVHISGHLETTQKEFDIYYVPKINIYITQGYKFIIGGAKGTDTMAQKYLSTCNNINVTVCDIKNFDNRLDKSFKHINGFETNVKRNEYMTNNSNFDLVFLHQYGGGGSGSCANLIRRKYGSKVAKDFQKLLRDHSMEYDKNIAKSTFLG